MKAILLLILAMSLRTGAAAMPRSPHDCCPDQHCSLQCIDMGCASGAPAIAPPPVRASWGAVDNGMVRIADPGSVLPLPYRDIRVPPD